MTGKELMTEKHATSVHIRIDESEALDTVRSFVDRSLQTSLQRFADRLRNIRVTVHDVNGPRGGVDKSCRIEAKLFPSRRWVMHEARDANVFAAVARALQHVKHTVRKSLERAKGRRARRETIRKTFVAAE